MHVLAAQLLLWVLPVLLPISILAAAAYWLTSRPLRREEHARFLLELIESALAQGRPVEHYIVGLAQTRDASLGARFQLLAAHLEQGLSLAAALEKVPGLAPPQLAAMLGVGESLGDYGRVLPACRELLHDGLSQSRASINYQAGFAFILNPIIAVALPFVAVKLLPTFRAINGALGVEPLPRLAFIIHILPWVCLLQMLLVLALYLFGALFLGGPRFVSWLERSLLPLAERFWLRLPWRRKRLQCDFSAMLALLLDAGLPEERAVTLAALSTANAGFIRLGREAVARLHAGMKLPEALQGIDDTGEFRWRLQNAGHGGGRFFQALHGWHEWLHARAYQQEQAAAQSISTGLLLLNAASVALVTALVIGSLAQITALHIQHLK
jgi:type II secretory pathway component PulF